MNRSNTSSPITYILVVSIALAGIPYIFAEGFSNLRSFDDQGTLMISIQDLINGYIPYKETFLLYGPFYYSVMVPLFEQLKIPLVHSWVLGVSCVFWFSCVVVFGTLVQRLTHSLVASCFASLVALFFLRYFVQSPIHPQEMSFLLIGILFHLLLSIEKIPKPATLIATGAILASLTLIKINLAALIALPILLGAARASGQYRSLRYLNAILVLSGIALPFILMKPLLELSWVVDYLWFSVMTISAALVVWCTNPVQQILNFRHWIFCFTGYLVLLLVVLATFVNNDLTVLELIAAVAIDPKSRINNWYGDPSIGNWALSSSSCSFLFAVYYSFGRNFDQTKKLANRMVQVLRLIVGGLTLVWLMVVLSRHIPSVRVVGYFFQWLVPFAWLFLVPVGEKPVPLPRQLMSLFAAFMVLYAFPVPWSQSVSATLWSMLCLPYLFIDYVKFKQLQNDLPRSGVSHNDARKRLWFKLAISLIMIGLLIVQTSRSIKRRGMLVPLSLPGSAHLRVHEYTATHYRWAVSKLSECDTFYTVPGMPSFYFWTGQKSPTGLINNNSLALLSEGQQLQAISDLESYKDLCILYIDGLVKRFDRGQILNPPPLLRYVQENFSQVDASGPFSLMKRLSEE